MNKYKRIISSLFLTVLVTSIALVAIPSHAFALTASSEAKFDYEVAVSFLTVKACKIQDYINKNDYSGSRTTWADVNSNISVGNLWSGSLKDKGVVDCNSASDMTSVVKVLGFDSLEAFNDAVAPRTGANSSCSGDNCKFRSDWVMVIDKKVRETSRPGPDNGLSSISAAGQYYFWLNAFKSTSCQGQLYTNQANYDKRPSDQRAQGPFYYYENGQVTTKVGAGFTPQDNVGDQLGVNFFDSGNVGRMLNEHAKPTELATFDYQQGLPCDQVVGKLKDNKLAQAMVDLNNEKIAIANQPGATEAQKADAKDQGILAILDSGSANPDNTCESNSILSLDWLLCGILGAISEGINQMFGFVENLLSVDSNQIINNKPNRLKQVWSYFRVLATILLIVIGLIMVISQAISIGPFDAYTIKKVLPKLVVAVILVQLSWYLFTWMILLVNNVAWGIENLMYAPFGGSLDTATILMNAAGGAGTIGAVFSGVALGAGAGALALGVPGLLALAGTAFLAVLIVFFVLALRQALIVVLLVMAPIALVAWILPNTEKGWKLWWESYSKVLLMYPMIILIIAGGKIAAYLIATGQNAGGSGVTLVICTLCIFGPYFLIPKTFQLAGTAFSNIAGIANNRSKGAFDRLRNYRGQKAAQNWQDLKQGSRFQDRRGPASWVNNAGKRVNAGWRGRFGVGEQGQQALSLNSAAAVEQTLKNNGALQQLANYDDGNAVLGLSGGSRRGAEEAARDLFTDAAGNYDQVRADRALSAAAAVGFNEQNATAAMTTMAQNKSRAVGAGRADIVQRGINRLSGDNARMATSLAYGYQYNSRNAGRTDLGGAWGQENVQNAAFELQQRAANNGEQITAQQALGHATMLDGLSRTDMTSLVRGHTSQVEQASASVQFALQHGTQQQRIVAGQRLLELQSSLPYATGDNQRVINDLMDGVGINRAPAEGQPSVANQIAALTNAGVTGGQLTAGARVYDREQLRDGGTDGPHAQT